MWRMGYTVIRNLKRLPGMIEIMHRMADRPDQYTAQEKYDHVRRIAGLMQKTGHIKTTASGLEHLPEKGGYVLYPNHQGKYDAYSIVAAHEKPLSVAMDREMSYFMLVSEIIDALGGKRMDIRDTRHALRIINEIAAEVAEGSRYIIFPEGAYDDRKHNTLWDFKPGCFKAATRAEAPIVPVALVDSYKVYNSPTPLPAKTEVHFLKPLYPAEYEGMSTHEVSDIVKARIQAKIEERKPNGK
ncbi:MAG: 1-acyl-sn-glycerol-3-phosphate acyltransferase [Clostridiales bacterium]|nr:1-acyl-sn-glycerol-3-phosphate acyltransferase [Clostridiales bacterium]